MRNTKMFEAVKFFNMLETIDFTSVRAYFYKNVSFSFKGMQ